MTTNADCYKVHDRPVEVSMSRRERLVALKFYFTSILAEDLRDGSPFDSEVMDTIDRLNEKYEKEEKAAA